MAGGAKAVESKSFNVVDLFTTRDGKWAYDGKDYGIPVDMLKKYGTWDIPGKGAATHIMVHAPVGAEVRFVNRHDGTGPDPMIVDKDGWVDFPIGGRGSGYNPEAGQDGPWDVYIDGEKVATGIGRPLGYHISTWVMTERKQGQGGNPPTLPPVPAGAHVQLYIDGVLRYDSKAT